MRDAECPGMLADLLVNAALLSVDAAALYAISKRIRIVTLRRMIAVFVLSPFLLIPPLFVFGPDAWCLIFAWAIFVHFVILLVGYAILRWKDRRYWAIASAASALLIAAVGVYASCIEPYWLEVSRHRIVSTKVTRPVKIAIIADLHADSIGDYERRVLELTKVENPDVVLFGGDYIQESDDARGQELNLELRTLLKECGFNFGVAVGGYWDRDDWPLIFQDTRIDVPGGVREYRHGDISVTALSRSESEYNPIGFNVTTNFHIVVGHLPNFALGPVQADLLVAGHMRGGQVRLPFIGPLTLFSKIPRSWADGITDLGGGRKLIVSRGIGMERGSAPRLRFLSRPELVIVEVVPEDRNAE